MADSLNLSPAFAGDDDELLPPLCDFCVPHVSFPDDALTTDRLAEALTGISVPDGTRLEDVFPPMFDGKPLDAALVPKISDTDDIMRVFAQFECSL